MEYLITSGEHRDLCEKIFKIVKAEYQNVSDVESQYSKFLIMYEFFRLLRGEAFTNYREPTPDFQKDLYKMEDRLAEMLEEIKSKISQADKAEFHNNIMKKGFD